jgi:PE-PPE domain
MRSMLRSLGAMVIAVLSAITLVVAATMSTAVQLAATALIMGGTGHPLSTPPDDPVTYINPYMANAVNGFINKAAAAPTGTGLAPIGVVADGDRRYAVITPEEFFPVSGSGTFDPSVAAGVDNLYHCIVGGGCTYNTNAALKPAAPPTPPVPGEETDVFGYSQSAVVAALVKQKLLADPDHPPVDLSFFLLADPMRPNGGFLARGPKGLTIPLLGVTFYGPAPTNSCDVGDCMETVDVAAQYDGLGGDAAVGLTNVLAVVNAALGYYYLHGDLQNKTFADARYQGSYGDTDYYLVPTPRLPVLMPLDGIVPSPILTGLDAPLRVLIEGGYAHDVNPGVPVGVSLLPFRNPIRTAVNVLIAIPTGIDDAIAEAANDPASRPLGTKPVTSPFGVGGADLPDPPSEVNISALATTAKGTAKEGAAKVDAAKGDAAKDGADQLDGQKKASHTDQDVSTITAGRKDESAEDDAADQPGGHGTTGTDTPSKPADATAAQTQAAHDETSGGTADSGSADAGASAAA